MSRRVADLLIKIGADSYEFKQKTREVEQGLGQLSQKLTSIGKSMSLAVTVPLTAIGVVALKGADDQAKAESKIRTAVEQTGQAAQLSLKQLSAYASELQSRSLFGDEQIMNDVTAKLLTFTNIAGDNFKRAQQSALDMATVLGTDVKGVVTQLGKALNDPVKNLSALSRMGIQFSKEQTDVIRSLAETNKLAEAQGIILDTLATRYGGQAEAAAKAGLGILTQLKNSWGDFLEELGAIMMPVVQAIARSLQGVVSALQGMDPHWKKFIVTVGAVAASIGPVLLALGGIMKLLPLLKGGFALLVAPIKTVIVVVKALTVAIASNPIGLLLTALAAGITLLVAFTSRTKEATEANGELTNKILDESRSVNSLIGVLTSANSSEEQRRAALQELRRIQPEIVSGLNDEASELETLKQRAAEYNRQLVLRIALARKQDEVSAAIERQTEAGVKQAEKEAELYAYLSDIGAKIAAGEFQFGRHNQNKGFYEWTRASESTMKYVQGYYTRVMASSESIEEKARQISLMFNPSTRYGDKIEMDGVSGRKLRSMQGSLHGLREEVSEAGALVTEAEESVRNFAEAFSLSLTEAVGGATGAVSGLGDAAAGSSAQAQKSIEELNTQIRELEEQKQKSFDPAEITAFNRQIESLKEEVNRLNSLGTKTATTTGTATTEVTGRIGELTDRIRQLEDAKARAYDVREIAEYNDKIAELRRELESLNSITLSALEVPQPVLAGNLAELSLPAPKFTLPSIDLKPLASRAAEQMRAIREYLKTELFGWAGSISEAFATDISEVGTIVKTYTDALTAKGWEFTAALEHVGSKVSETMKRFDEELSSFLSNSIVAAAEAIGQIMAGDLGFGGLMKAILVQFASFLKNIGAQLIEFGVMMIAFKTVLKSVLANPWAAIAVGAAMVAAAALMTALINKNAKENAPKLAKGGLAFGPTYAMVGDNPGARTDPEVIAPLSKLKSLMTVGGATNVNITLSGELRAKGRDLVYALGKENFKTDVLGG